MSLQRVGFSRCVRCDFTTEGIKDFSEQDKQMSEHLDKVHPGWVLETVATKPQESEMSDFHAVATDNLPHNICARNCTCNTNCHFDCEASCCECVYHSRVEGRRRPRHKYKTRSWSDINGTESSRSCEVCGKYL